MSVPSQPAAPEQPSRSGSWWTDVAVAVVLVGVLALLRPCWPDGDAQGHVGRAVNRGLAGGMETKHILYAPLLRCLLLGLESIGLRAYAIVAFTALSNLCGGILYLLLARGLFAPPLRDLGLARTCALGTLFSFGVMASCATIETYALALTLAVALATVCVRTGLHTAGQAAAAALLFVLAVGVHVTNVLTLPFVLAVLLTSARRHGWGATAAFGAVVLGGALVLGSALVLGVPTETGGPNWGRLVPAGDPHPSMSAGARVGRAVYGFFRTFAWIAPYHEVSRAFLAGHAAVFLLAGLLVVFVAGRGFLGDLGRYRWPALLLLLLVLPFVAIGLAYYPSDPERWLFLMPPVWLVLGVIWRDDRAGPDARPSPAVARGLLLLVVLVMGSYNALFKLWPETRASRELDGLTELQRLTSSNDLVVADSGLRGVTEEFLLRRPLRCDVLALDRLMLEEHRRDVAACRADLRRQVADALARGRRVLVFGLLGEDLAEGRGYPWAHAQPLGYTPRSMLSVLEEFHPVPVVRADADHVGV
jgi:hypothetical protein